jgi:type I restriction enzyme S subunit
MGSFGITGRHDTAACKGPGVTVGRSGASIGTVAYIAEDYWPLNTCLYVREFHGNNPLFCYYFLKTIDLAAHNSGSAQPSLNRNYVHPLPVRFPDRREQDAIAATLGALDDKIELNRKMNATLEAMARALFRDWFVDFGPTRAKMEGRPPYFSPDLWSLFPDRLDDEGKPEGWKVFRLGQIADHHTKTVSPSASPQTLFEHFSLPAFDKGQDPALDPGDTIKSNKTLVPPGAILLSKLNPEIPRVWLPEAENGHPQIASTEFLAYSGKNGVQRGLLFCLFSDNDFRRTLQSMVTGTSKSHQRISPPELLGREVLLGKSDLFVRFDEMVAPILKRVLANRAESRTLAQTRDLLLPRLMSGELRVAGVEQRAAEVA